MKKSIFLSLLLSIFSAHTLAAGGGGTATASEYFSFSKPFVVNIMDNNKMRFLQVAVQVKLVDPANAPEIAHNQDAISHNLIMLLSSQEARDLYSITGKERLRQAALKEIRNALKGLSVHAEIEEVFFTSFIIQ